MISLIGKLAGQDFEEFDLQREGSFSCQQKETWTIKRDDGKRQKV